MSLKGKPSISTAWNRPLERLRGMDDLLPAAAYELRRAERILSGMAESYGYQPIDVPVLEPTELFLRKSGEALAPKLYAFDFRNHDICVRPEFTASVGRLYVDQLQDAPLPQRLYYCGPVLRHEKPQRGRRRQFTQLGLELIGASGPMADAEIILAACDGLEAVGRHAYRVVLGHIGATLQMLGHLKLDPRARNFLLTNLENLARSDRGLPYVEARLAELYPAESGAPSGTPHIPPGMDRAEARALLTSLLGRLDAEMALGGRSVEEIVDSVLDRLLRQDQVPLIRQALRLAEELHALSGAPGQALPAAAELLAANRLSEEPLRELARIVDLLCQAGLSEDRITVNLGFGRGLQYYTGMIFEIYGGEAEGEDQQLCGGGRYDDLITSMGGRKRTPACGFAYRLQRLLDGQAAPLPMAGMDVLVTPQAEDLTGVALGLTRSLRRAGLKAEADVRQRGTRANLQYASKSNIRYVVTVGGDREAPTYELRDRDENASVEMSHVEDLLQWARRVSHARGMRASSGEGTDDN